MPLSKINGLIKDTKNKDRIIKKIGTLNPSTMKKVDMALKLSLGIDQ